MDDISTLENKKVGKPYNVADDRHVNFSWQPIVISIFNLSQFCAP